MSLAEIIQPSYVQAATNMLFYEMLDVSIIELEHKRNIRITWMGAHNREEVSFVASSRVSSLMNIMFCCGQSTQQFLLPKTTSVTDLAGELAKVVKLSPEGTNKIRVFEATHNHRQQKQLNGNEMIRDIGHENELFAEVRGIAPPVARMLTFVRPHNRRSQWMRCRLTKMTSSSACSTTRRNQPVLTVSRSVLSLSLYASCWDLSLPSKLALMSCLSCILE